MTCRKMLLGVLMVLLVAGCAAPTPSRPQSVAPAASAPAVSAPAATATRARQGQVRPTQTVTSAVTATALPSATRSPAPTATATLAPTATATPVKVTGAVNPVAAVTRASGVLLALDARKYPSPALLGPENNATYHVSQPVVHFAWSPTPTDLLKFGQMPGCVSDAVNFRRAFESYQLVIRSLDGTRPDQARWTDNNPSFDLNLTTVPAGRYAWTVNVVTLCESYVVGQRHDTHPLYENRNSDPAYHPSTLQTTLVGAVSPWSATRSINWVP